MNKGDAFFAPHASLAPYRLASRHCLFKHWRGRAIFFYSFSYDQITTSIGITLTRNRFLGSLRYDGQILLQPLSYCLLETKYNPLPLLFLTFYLWITCRVKKSLYFLTKPIHLMCPSLPNIIQRIYVTQTKLQHAYYGHVINFLLVLEYLGLSVYCTIHVQMDKIWTRNRLWSVHAFQNSIVKALYKGLQIIVF